MEQQEWLAVLAGVLILVLLFAVGALAFLSREASSDKPEPEPQAQQEPAVARPRAAGRLAAGARRRRQLARDAEAEDGEEDGAAQQAQDEPQQQAEPHKFSRRDAYEERRRKRDEEREAQQLAEEQEAAQKEAERQAKEDAEAAKWLDQMSIEKEGTGASAAEEEQDMLQSFVEYIIERKTVVLEELAADFQLRVQDVIARMNSLLAMGRITGIMDDRGKFIYVSMAEMEAVADFIKSNGRVSIAELAAKSTTFIDLEMKEGKPVAAADADLDLDQDVDIDEQLMED